MLALLKLNTNMVGWFRVVSFAGGAFYLWRSALFPKTCEPRKWFDRSLRVVGAILLTALAIYFLGYGLGVFQ